MQITNNNIQIPQILKTPEATKKVAKIAAPSLIASGAVMLATKAPKGAVENPVKMTTRLSRAGLAGIMTAAIVTIITLADKDKIVQGVNKVKEIFRRNRAEKELDNTKPIEPAEAKTTPEKKEETQPLSNETEINNPFANSENVKIPQEENKPAATNPLATGNPFGLTVKPQK